MESQPVAATTGGPPDALVLPSSAAPRVELGRPHRDALHACAIDSLGDLGAALEADDYERIRWLRPRLNTVMRLLDDIGWSPSDPGEQFAITMDTRPLLLALEYLGDRVAGDLLPPIQEVEPDEPARQRAREAAQVIVAVDAVRRQLRQQRSAAGPKPPAPVVLASQTLTREERGLLFEATWNLVAATVRTLPAAVQAGEFHHARHERLRLESEFQIIDALGWSPDDPRPQVEVTLPPDLLARALTRLRWAELRGPGVAHEGMRVGPLAIDTAARTVEFDSKPIAVSEKEFQLLLRLATDPGRVFTKKQLLREIWGQRLLSSTRTLDSHACRLRRKLRAAGAERFIVNVWGVGYRLHDAVTGA